MKRIFLFISVFFLIYFYSYSQKAMEIHCKHFFFGMPLGTASTNDLIIRDNYALSSNDSTKFADWVAYRLERRYLDGRAPDRHWKADPWLSDDETLEPDDYRDASKIIHVDRGHLAPLASFKGSESCFETNYLSNITPQKINLNRGPWKLLEEKERKLLDTFELVFVMTGPLYEKDMGKLPNANEKHLIPSAYWKIIIVPITQKKFEAVAFIFSQDVDYNVRFIDHLTSIDEIERRSKLDFFPLLDNITEEKIEKEINKRWTLKFFNN